MGDAHGRRMERTDLPRGATGLAAAVLVGGLVMALTYSGIESLLNPGYSLVDGYWLGALPWMGLIEGMVVGGATASVLAGTIAVAVRGGWARRALALAAGAVAGLWWLMAVIGAGLSGAACADCVRAIDPWAYAYSSPVTTLQLLIIPAGIVILLALLPRAAE
jgi:hypothetical protein